jgi:regulator of Ty1 transposition protein 103
VRYKKADDLCQKLGIDVARQEPSKGLENSSLSEVPVTSFPVSANGDSFEKRQSTAVMYSQEGDGGEHEILNGGFSSRATRDNIEQKIEEHSPGIKRQKLENGVSAPQPQAPPPPPPFPYPDFEQPPPPPQYPPSPESSPPPLPPSMPPPIPPPPPPTTDVFMPVPAAPMGGMPYSVFPPFPPTVNYPMINMPPPFPGAPNPPHLGFPGFGGPFYGPSFPSAPHQ